MRTIGDRFTILWFIVLLSFSCQTGQSDGYKKETTFHKLQGMTMGTSWHLTYEGEGDDLITIDRVEDLLNLINHAASTYMPESIISRLNQGETIVVAEENPEEVEFFRSVVTISGKVWEWSNGYFDPTVMELVNYWGFGYEGHRPVETVDSVLIDSLLQYVGYGEIGDRFESETWQLPPGFQLDFSAVAKGAACDWLGRAFEKMGFSNYLIEIGGEMLVQGPGREGEGWIVGVSKPVLHAPTRELIEELAIMDKALATSGNYRNYYESKGRMIAHTINPKTGYSEEKSILSATIVAEDCGTADALATAVMAMGMDKGKQVLDSIPGIEAYLIYNNGADSMLIYETAGMNSLKYNTTEP